MTVASSALPIPVGRQREVLYLPAQGHTVVLGAAGSGKTTLAILRAAYLANPKTDHGGKTLLVTFNRALVAYLKHFKGPDFTDVSVENYHQFARGYLSSRGKMGFNSICSPDLRNTLIGSALLTVSARIGKHKLLTRGVEFFSSEIQWIAQHGIRNLKDYVAAERVGRGALRLDRDSREIVFAVLQEYLSNRASRHKQFDWDDVANAVCDELGSDGSSRLYKHIVIDEGQDFSPQMVRSLSLAVPSDGSLTFFGDMAQQIYGRLMSWKSAGLKITKAWEFKENYRNTKQIAKLGLAISRMPFFKDTPDLVEPIEPKADGPLPALVECSSPEAEMKIIKTQVSEAAKTQTVAVLTRNWELAARVAKHLPGTAVKLHRELSTWQAGPKVYYGTYHGGKGLEFDIVLLPFFSESFLPDPEVVRAFGPEEAEIIDGKLVYVGITRAKTRLIMSYTDKVTRLLPKEDGLYVKSKP
jgi:superfamily I DNA/RNA helicase